VIELNDVFKIYENGTKALNGITMTIEDGEFVFIRGASGAGKSTLIKLLMSSIILTFQNLKEALYHFFVALWVWFFRIFVYFKT
jgi:ABC-type ATPase involved in cell division